MEEPIQERIDSLFERALALPAAERDGFLARECGDDERLRREVASLIAYDVGAEDVIAGAVSRAVDSLPAPRPSFEGNARFELGGEIGSGGFGTVYRATDREHGIVVALKALHRSSTIAVAQFKLEFRSLAEIVHPNLMRLYEFFSLSPEQHFYTMELIDGVDIVESVRQRPDQVRAVFLQLARGIQALHEAGVLHCDLKPSNILVTREGRAVILDFGLVRPSAPHASEASTFGTRGYSAPEQVAGLPVTRASDWYSAGVVMKECLEPLPAPPPDDLRDLVQALTGDDPKSRLSGAEVLARLGDASRTEPALNEQIFVGRERELAALEDSYIAARSGTTVQEVIGPPGIGKTTLARAFAASVEAHGGTVLASRCRNRESTPFRALDEIATGIGRLLGKAPARGSDAARELAAVLFPQLISLPLTHGQGVNRRACFQAFEELLRRLVKQTGQPLVFWIDDAQWGDADSAALLTHLESGVSEPLPLLILMTRREGEASGGLANRAAPHRRLHLGALPIDAARELVNALAPRYSATDIGVLVSEADGNPYLLSELAREPGAAGASGMGEIVQRRLSNLPPSAHGLLRVLAVANQGVDWRVARSAAGDEPHSYDSMVMLQSVRLLRVTPVPGSSAPKVETYHDRIADAVRHSLTDGESRGLHLRLAEAAESITPNDAESVAWHFAEAAEHSRASPYARIAGDRAWSATAYDSASRFYRIAERGSDSVSRADIRRKLAAACVNAGHAHEAAELFAAMAETDEPGMSLELRMKAARHFLISGHIDRSRKVMGTVLKDAGLEMIPEPDRAMLTGMRMSMQAALLSIFSTPEPSLPEHQRLMEICRMMGTTYAVFDPIQGASFQARWLLLTSQWRDDASRSAALAQQALYLSSTPLLRRLTDPLLERARKVAERSGSPLAQARVLLTSGFIGSAHLNWRRGLHYVELASRFIYERCPESAWELSVHRLLLAKALYMCGEYARLREIIPQYWRDVGERGDLYVALPLECFLSMLEMLSGGDSGAARTRVEQAVKRWPSRLIGPVGHAVLLAQLEIASYEGNYGLAAAHWRSAWQRLWPAENIATRVMNMDLRIRRANAAVGLSHRAAGAQKQALIESALADCSLLSFPPTPLGKGSATAIRAAVAIERGNRRKAARLFLDAEKTFEAASLIGYAAAVRRHRGVLLGGSEGGQLVADADQRYRAQGIAHPERVAQMLIAAPSLAQ
ncbi:MAG: protein kinase [Bryobacteraceae bacterium]